MRRPSLRVQRAYAGTSARAGDLANAVGVARTSLAAFNTSLPEVNAGTSAVTHQTGGNQQVINVSESSEATIADGAPSFLKRAQTLPEVQPAGEPTLIAQEINFPEGERVEPMASNPEALYPGIGVPRVGPKVEVGDRGVEVGLSPKARLVLRR